MTRSLGGGSMPGNVPEGGQQSDESGGSTQGQDIQPARIDVGKRAVALVIDFAVSYLVGVCITFIPFIRDFLPLQFTMVLVLLSRDYFFEGRGIGKNLMGLQVVDFETGAPATILQSIQRNIILIAPFVVMQVITLVLRVVPIAWLNDTVINLINLVGTLYCAVVIPVEAYRAYSRADGLRIGDEIAGTALIEAPMDFSCFLPRQDTRR